MTGLLVVVSSGDEWKTKTPSLNPSGVLTTENTSTLYIAIKPGQGLLEFQCD